MLPGCWVVLPRPPWEMSSTSLGRNIKSSARSKMCPTCSSFTKSLLFALVQTTPGNPPNMTARQWVHWSARNLARCFHLCWNPLDFVSSHVNQRISFHPSIILFRVLCSSSTDCFGNGTFRNTKEPSDDVCYTLMRGEGNAPCSTAAEETLASSSDQKTLLWEEQAPACRVGNEQEGLGLWKGI